MHRNEEVQIITEEGIFIQRTKDGMLIAEWFDTKNININDYDNNNY